MKYLLLIISILILWSCAQESTSPKSTADTLYTNGIIWTGVAGASEAQTIAVKDGLITYVGANATQISATETIDLQGRFLMHGFIDNHVHFLEGGAALASVKLRDAATPEEFSNRIATYAATLSKGRWVLNGNWDHEIWGGTLPNKAWIDASTPDTPVFVIRLDGHMALANSAALKLAGITKETVSPISGEIIKDATGELTGILKDTAMNMVLEIIPAPSETEILQSFELAQSHALSLGLTEVHALIAYPTETTMLETFQLARDKGILKIRAYVLTPIEQWQKAKDTLHQSGPGDGLLRWGGVKGFVDGSLGSTTAWFHEPYTDRPDTNGFALMQPEDLKEYMISADAAGLNLAIHAIGDKAIDEVMETMQDIAGPEITKRRFRIEHFQHPSAKAIDALALNGIIASMQPYHAIDDGRWAENRIGSERAKMAYAFRSILEAGGTLTFGSDWPVAPLAPLEGVYAAVTRQTTDGAHPDGWQPQEKITVEQALTAYTASNAYAGFQEDKAGTLKVGNRADFVILSEDPRTIPPHAIPSIQVLKTVINGETVYNRSN